MVVCKRERYYFPKDGTVYNKRFYQLADEVGMDSLGKHTPMYYERDKDGNPLHRIVINKEALTEEIIKAANYLQ